MLVFELVVVFGLAAFRTGRGIVDARAFAMPVVVILGIGVMRATGGRPA